MKDFRHDAGMNEQERSEGREAAKIDGASRLGDLRHRASDVIDQ